MQQGNIPGKEKAARDRNQEQKKNSGKNEPDTAPDEFIAPNADTDQPLDDKGIVNDAVLGGEDHQTINPDRLPKENKK